MADAVDAAAAVRAVDAAAAVRAVRGVALQARDTCVESQCLRLYAAAHGIPLRVCARACDVPLGWVAYGDVRWVEEALRRCKPDVDLTPAYYPACLSAWLRRRVWLQPKWPLGQHVFVKPGDRQKRFPGVVSNGGYRGKKGNGPFWCSDVVAFQDEWRCYVVRGQVRAVQRYASTQAVSAAAAFAAAAVAAAEGAGGTVSNVASQGVAEQAAVAADAGAFDARDKLTRALNDVAWPPDFCACVDVGKLPSGEFALVEVNPLYACGWYGSVDDEVFGHAICVAWTVLTSPESPVAPPGSVVVNA